MEAKVGVVCGRSEDWEEVEELLETLDRVETELTELVPVRAPATVPVELFEVGERLDTAKAGVPTLEDEENTVEDEATLVVELLELEATVEVVAEDAVEELELLDELELAVCASAVIPLPPRREPSPD